MKKGDIYFINLKRNNGYIQAGARPVIIIQNNLGNLKSGITIVACITTNTKRINFPTHVFLRKGVGGLPKDSVILCEQIMTINKTDLKQYVGTIKHHPKLKEVDEKIQLSLGIKGD